MLTKIDSIKAETLAKWYLRFNGYFIVDNFIIHDAETQSKGVIAPYTETDLLAIRHKFNKEQSGEVQFQNDEKLLSNTDSSIDFLIVEVKTGQSNKLNKAWDNNGLIILEYILRFAGFIESEQTIKQVATELLKEGKYDDSDGRYTVRVLLISEVPISKKWEHVKNILFDDVIDYLVDVRGKCWINSEKGIASAHNQWDSLINNIFKLANNHELDLAVQKEKIKKLLQTDGN